MGEKTISHWDIMQVYDPQLSESVSAWRKQLTQNEVIPPKYQELMKLAMVDLRAAKTGLASADRDKIPPLKETMKRGWVYLLPLVVIVGMMMIGRSALSSAVWSTALLIVIAMLSPDVHMDGNKMLKSICKGVIDTANVSSTAATAGFIVGGIMISGLGLKLTQMIIGISHGILPLALVSAPVIKCKKTPIKKCRKMAEGRKEW